MPETRLNAADAAELAEMLQFLTGWLACDPARLAASLAEFIGHSAYGIGQLRDDLERFTFPARRQRRRTPLQPMTRHPGPAELGLAGLNVVLALARCGRCTLAPPEPDCA